MRNSGIGSSVYKSALHADGVYSVCTKHKAFRCGPWVTYILENWLGKFLSRVRRITHYTEAETASQ